MENFHAPFFFRDDFLIDLSTFVSALNFVLLSFPNIPSCIAISHNPSQPSRDACPTLHPPLRFIPHDPHGPNDSYNLCLKTNQLLGVYRDILECYPGHPDPSRPRGLLPHPTSCIPMLNGRSASRVTGQPGTAHKRPNRPDHRMIRWIDLTWSVHHHSNTVQL